jgi:DNA-binding transcriptional ArsR family regulator
LDTKIEKGIQGTMDDIPETYAIERVEQMRAVADRLRVRIIELLAHQPMTVAQLSEQLHLAHAKVHYHVRELEQVGLVRLVETREKGGILEKYYRAVASSITVSPSLLSSSARDESVELASRMLADLTGSFTRALSRWTAAPESEVFPAGMGTSSLFITKDETEALSARLREALMPYAVPRGVEGEHEVMLVQLLFEDDSTAGEQSDDDSPTEAAATKPAPVAGVRPVAQPHAPRPIGRAATSGSRRRDHLAITAGSTDYSRAQLEALATRGERLAIYALGVVTFEDDVPADLVDRVIRRMRIRGRLNASPEVRAVIERKEKV